MNFDFTEIRFFVLFYELKNAFITPLYLLFLFTHKRAVLSSAQTDQSQFSFPTGFQHTIEHAPETGQCVITLTNDNEHMHGDA